MNLAKDFIATKLWEFLLTKIFVKNICFWKLNPHFIIHLFSRQFYIAKLKQFQIVLEYVHFFCKFGLLALDGSVRLTKIIQVHFQTIFFICYELQIYRIPKTPIHCNYILLLFGQKKVFYTYNKSYCEWLRKEATNTSIVCSTCISVPNN